MYNSKDGWKDNLNSNDEYLASYEEGQVQIQRLRAIEEKEKNARRKQKLEEAEKVLKAREEQVRLVFVCSRLFRRTWPLPYRTPRWSTRRARQGCRQRLRGKHRLLPETLSWKSTTAEQTTWMKTRFHRTQPNAPGRLLLPQLAIR